MLLYFNRSITCSSSHFLAIEENSLQHNEKLTISSGETSSTIPMKSSVGSLGAVIFAGNPQDLIGEGLGQLRCIEIVKGMPVKLDRGGLEVRSRLYNRGG